MGVGRGSEELDDSNVSSVKPMASMAKQPVAARPTPHSPARLPLVAVALCAIATLVAACTPQPPNTDIRQWAGGMAFRIGMIPVPPRAREPIQYKIVVLDQESRQPIESGEGRIFAMNKDSVRVWDALEYGPEPGTYHAKISFVTSGPWAIGLEFRRDSTHRLERMDWTQEVFAGQ